MKNLEIETERGTILNGVLFSEKKSDTVLIAITGIHGNFYSNPFYFNIGETLKICTWKISQSEAKMD